MITLSDIVKAKYRIQSYIHKTPLMLSETLSDEVDAKVYVKLESLQKTGAFKIRGILNKLLALTSEGSIENALFVTASSGNHGYGLAYAAKLLGVKALVVVPSYTPEKKWKAIERTGAKVLRKGDNWNEAFSVAETLAAEESGVLVHPFDDDEIISGQGTIALEILEEISEAPDYFLASIGGGSMISANSLVFKELSPDTKVIGLQTYGADAMYQSFKNGELTSIEKISSKVESFATLEVSERTFDLTSRFVDEIIRLNDEDCRRAAVFMLERSNILLEWSASICVSAVLNRSFGYAEGSSIVLTLCGGNYNLLELDRDLARYSDVLGGDSELANLN